MKLKIVRNLKESEMEEDEYKYIADETLREMQEERREGILLLYFPAKNIAYNRQSPFEYKYFYPICYRVYASTEALEPVAAQIQQRIDKIASKVTRDKVSRVGTGRLRLMSEREEEVFTDSIHVEVMTRIDRIMKHAGFELTEDNERQNWVWYEKTEE